MKNTVKINESQLHKIISESVKKRLNEFRSYLNDDDFAVANSDANGSAAKTWANNYANKNIKPNPQQPNNGKISEEMVDRNGDKYIEDESFPAGGGLDDRCTYNKDCIAAFDLCSSDKIAQFLSKRGFSLLDNDGFSERWQKGDTIVTFDGYANNCYGYMTTEYNPNGRINPYFVHENKLNKIVAESVKKVLKENLGITKYESEFRTAINIITNNLECESPKIGKDNNGYSYCDIEFPSVSMSLRLYCYNEETGELGARLDNEYGTNMYDYVCAAQGAPLGRITDRTGRGLAQKIVSDVQSIEKSFESED